MKFIKKVAALCFCAALALSVMAISASATGPSFSLKLEQNDEDAHVSVADTQTPYDYKTDDTVLYDIILSETGGGTYNVNAIQFTLNYDENNFADATVKIGSQTFSNVENGDVIDYLAENAASPDNYLSIDGATAFGTITFTTAASITPATDGDPSVEAEFSVSNATVHYAANTQSATVTTGQNAAASVEVHKNYQITLMTYEFDENTGIKDTDTTTDLLDENDAAIVIDYNIVDGIPNDGVVSAPEQLYYDFTGWAVTADDDDWCNWQDIDDSSDYTLPTGEDALFGDVTLTAQWTPTTYTATLAHGVTDSNNESHSDVTIDTSADYTIEDVDALSALEPTRLGYNFAGWKVTEANDDPTNWAVWDETDNDVIYNSGSYEDGADFETGMYGNITLTAQWEIDGDFVLKNYNFAYRTSRGSDGAGNALLFFATTRTDTGTYKIDGEAMYDVTETYSDLDCFNGYTSIYAYVGDENLGLDDITFIGGTANEVVEYDGDVNGTDGNVDVGDYGTAGTVFRTSTAYQSDLSVLQRLKMNSVTPTTNDWFGSIADLAAIITAAAG